MPISTSNSGFRAQVWIKKLLFEAQQKMFFNRMGQVSTIKDGGKGIIMQKTDLIKKQGEKIEIAFSPFLTGDGIEGDNELEGNEEEMSLFTQEVEIDQIRNAVRLKGRMDEQKAAYSMRSQARQSLTDWLARKWEKEIFWKLGGIVGKTFSNTPTVPSSSRALFGGNATSDSDIDSSDVLDTDLISKLKVLAETEVSGVPIIQDLGLPKGVRYVLFAHSFQIYDLKRDSVWMQANREAGIRGVKNPLFQDAAGMWDSVLVVKHPFIETFSTFGSGGNLPGARALLCGRSAICMAHGMDLKWVEKSFDFGNKWAIAAGAIFGLQKTKFNSIDWGVIAADTYAINPNA